MSATKPVDVANWLSSMLEFSKTGSTSARRSLMTPSGMRFDESNLSDLSRVSNTSNPKRSISMMLMESPEPEFKRSRANISGLSASELEATWEYKKLKAEMVSAKTEITFLENKITQLQNMQKEQDMLFENEKTHLLEQRDREKAVVKDLQSCIKGLKSQKTELKNEVEERRKAMDSLKQLLNKELLNLRKENYELKEKMRQMENYEEKAADRQRLLQLEADLNTMRDERDMYQRQSEVHEKRFAESVVEKSHTEQENMRLLREYQELKEFQSQQERLKDDTELVKCQQDKLLRCEKMEREIKKLKEVNERLSTATSNNLLLEEQVRSLESKLAAVQQQEQTLQQLMSSEQELRATLEEWRGLAAELCGTSEERLHVPHTARIKIQDLKKQVFMLMCDKTELNSQLNAAKKRCIDLEGELQDTSKVVEKERNLNNQNASLIRRLQKKIVLLTRERDSYRSQLELYETDPKPPGRDGAAAQQSCAIESLEKNLANYREMSGKLEAELEEALQTNKKLSEKLLQLELERDNLLRDKQVLQQHKNELEMNMECRIMKGDFDPSRTKVLHFRHNPAAEVEQKQQQHVEELESNWRRLSERVKLLEAGQQEDVTEQVEKRLQSDSSQQVQELKEQIKSYDMKIQRIKEAFKRTSQEYREACYMLLGYKIDRLDHNQYRLLSMYAESPAETLLFQLTSEGTLNLLETPYSATLDELVELHLRQHHSMPMFLNAVTVQLFNRQTLAEPATY